MELLVIVLVLVGLGLAGYAWFSRARSSSLGQRTETYLRSERSQPASNTPREATVETLAPGDAVSFWDGEDAIVETVLRLSPVPIDPQLSSFHSGPSPAIGRRFRNAPRILSGDCIRTPSTTAKMAAAYSARSPPSP